MKNKTVIPLVFLLILAPVCGELLSTSSPPAEFFQPLSLITLVALYGGGAVLIREMAVRWGKGWVSIFVLGMAYGIYEEGLVVRSFFDPGWGDLGILAEYGRFLGVNWVWAAALTLFHAVVSICMPILIVHLLFPTLKNGPWLGKRGLIWVTIFLLITLVFGPLAGMKISVIAFILTSIVIAMLILAAYLIPNTRSSRKGKPAPGWWLFLVGFSSMLWLVFILWGFPSQGAPVLLTLFLALLLPGLYGILLLVSGVKHWKSRHQWWFVFGVLSLWIFLAFQATFDVNRVDNPAGLSLFAIIFLISYILLGITVHRRDKMEKIEPVY